MNKILSYIALVIIFFSSCKTKEEKIIEGDSTYIDVTLKEIPSIPHYDAAISRAMIDVVPDGNQRFGTYLTTGQLSQDKIESFRKLLRGVRYRDGWVTYNTGNGIYNYSTLLNAINLCKLDSNKLSLLFQVWRSPLKQTPFFWRNAPFNVPVVDTDDTRPDLDQYLYYLDTNYIKLCDAATNNLAGWLKGLTADQKKVIIGWLGSFGVTGDYGAYKGVPDQSKFIIENNAWVDYVHTSVQKLIAANAINPWLNIALNPNNNAEDWEFDLSQGVKVIKRGEIGHGYSQNGEGTFFRLQLSALSVDPLLIFFSESEGVQTAPSWTSQDFLPLVAGFVASGAKILSVAATDNITDTSLAFLNLYAGSTTGGFSYQRDVLDYADSSRFKENIYGTVIDPARKNQYLQQVQRINSDPSTGLATKGERLSALLANYINPIRVSKIQAEYAKRGYLFKIDNVHENDGGVDLWPGNYEMRLHQKVFEGYGVQRVGKSSNQAFGRYSKSINYAAWDYDDSTISEIKITYFDNKGAFSVRALHENNAALVATISCKNSQRWVQQTFSINGFKKRGINGNDVVISKVRGNCLLQIIEVK